MLLPPTMPSSSCCHLKMAICSTIGYIVEKPSKKSVFQVYKKEKSRVGSFFIS